MIPHAEILALRGEWSLRADVIEKDYMLGWMLAVIAAAPELSETWVFKGGTCLRSVSGHCSLTARHSRTPIG